MLFDLIDGDLPLCAVAAVLFSSVGSVAPKEVQVEVSAKIKRIFPFLCALSFDRLWPLSLSEVAAAICSSLAAK